MQVIPLDREVPETWTVGPAARALRRGELVVLPTDTIYALACDPWDRQAVARLYAAKGVGPSHRCSVMCGDLKDVGSVARAVSNDAFRFLRAYLPGPYTVLLHASRDLPRQATGKRKTIGVRMADHEVAQAVVEDFGGPILVTSVPGWGPGDPVDPVAIAERLPIRPTVVLDQGPQLAEPSTVVDFTQSPPELIRQGKGPVDLEG
jgi:tRNA threonylcarbamoyl adenosine modification protein (Sua5/YciO/YrdC/YwlC family)